MHGWPKVVNKELEPYFLRRYELSLDMNCLLWNNRVVIPSSLRKSVLDLLHEEHPGINKMKMLARGIVWRPDIDKDLEESVKKCDICDSVRTSVPAAPLQQWMWCSNNWERVHLDLHLYPKRMASLFWSWLIQLRKQ